MRVYKIKYEKNKHQKEFQEDLTSKYLAMVTGYGGGKTTGLVMKLIQLSRINKNINGGCVAPSIADYKKDMLPIFEDILEGANIPYRYNKSDKWFQFPWSKGKLQVASAEKKIRGPNWGYAGINEVTLISHERFREVIGRVRIKNAPCPQVAIVGTPEGTDHWFYESFVEKPINRSRLISGDTRDNVANLGDDYIRSLEESYDQVMLDAYLRGLFVNMHGSRFYYAYDPAVNDDHGITQAEGAEVCVSLDYNVSPMIATLWNIVIRKHASGGWELDSEGRPIREAHAFDQIEILDGADTHKMSHALYAYGLDPEHTTIYPDPAGKARSTKGPPDNEILKAEGWKKIKVKNVAPRFRARQLAVCNLMSKGQIKLNPIKAKALKKDCEAVQQDKATMEKIKSNEKLTHASDGMDYFIDIEFPLSGQKPDAGSIKYR